ncbi:MAG TPA: DUF378 domain-containing protein [Nocardioidaceae bacterium]|nr:DUF378 domain-containing protein [Nocardioidaceae bacterium]
MKKIDLVAAALVIVGALNWGLVALVRFDLVAAVFGLDFGETNAATRIIYGLVGLSGVWLITRAPAFANSTGRRTAVRT